LCEFWLFLGFKRHLRGIKFNSEEEIDWAVMAYFDAISIERRSRCGRKKRSSA
jgi:hypothetical protein